jgi:TP901 family phage tail tape measure protein
MGLTTETLKMARIAGIDYAIAADYMTTAIRGFKLEMTEAAHVTDVFSNLAAHTASSTEELATAISKTAASAASVGASFESTSAMMATMIATTRESATNIGTALKSIISRYGEMKANPLGIDSEGEAYSLNKVDAALQSVGITIHDAAGQFRDFDDVILELASAWDTIDKNTQRYIATVMAGNRQQSRFLALVSNVEEYKRALELANDSEGAGELQTLKTLDSIDAKLERMKVTIQEFYTSSGLEELYKNILDTITNIISAANSLPKMFDKIPVQALAIGANIVRIIKSIALLIINSIRSTLKLATGEASVSMKNIINAIASHLPTIKTQLSNTVEEGITEGGQRGAATLSGSISGGIKGLLKNSASIIGTYGGAALSALGATLSLSGMNKYGASTS